ncbi:MAG TPA: SRPBCC family protein [Candidatus Thermoplasmatota archaeon]|nr:SRPBCC family protein [Candidatus Thermoplasmatota archaeon]
MTRVARETTVRAPLERVFQALVDPSQRARWVQSVREAGGGEPLAVGRVVEARRTLPTSRSQYRMTVLRLEAPRLLEMEVERNGDRVGRAGYELSPAPEGTRVRAYGEVELKGFQKLAAPMVSKGMEDELAVDLAGLKRHVETS